MARSPSGDRGAGRRYRVVLVGHMVVASGVLPGYRGVWRSMHLGGRLPVAVARRIWPAWLDRDAR